MTSGSGLCPSPTEHEYKPRFFDEPEWLSSNKENMPPIESVTPPSLSNLSLEEEINEPEHKATSWEANVARNLETFPRSSSPFPRKTSTLEDLEPDTDDSMVDITDFFERPPNKKRSPRPKQTTTTHLTAQEQCTTPQNSPTHIPMNSTTTAALPAKPHRTEIWGILPDKRKVPRGWPACLRRQPPRVVFRNSDIYVVDDEESSNYKEPRKRHPKVQYKLQVCKNPAAKNMPHKEEYDDNNYESIDETAV